MIWLYLSLIFHCTYLSTPAGQQQCKPEDLLLSDSTKPPSGVSSNAMSLPKRRKLPWARHEESAGDCRDCFQTEVYKYVKILQVFQVFLAGCKAVARSPSPRWSRQSGPKQGHRSQQNQKPAQQQELPYRKHGRGEGYRNESILWRLFMYCTSLCQPFACSVWFDFDFTQGGENSRWSCKGLTMASPFVHLQYVWIRCFAIHDWEFPEDGKHLHIDTKHLTTMIGTGAIL